MAGYTEPTSVDGSCGPCVGGSKDCRFVPLVSKVVCYSAWVVWYGDGGGLVECRRLKIAAWVVCPGAGHGVWGKVATLLGDLDAGLLFDCSPYAPETS